MSKTLPILATLLLVSACGLKTTAPRASVNDAWVRMAAVPGGPAAGYFEVDINGTRETLRSVTSPSAGRIEMHFTATEGGVTRMRPIDEWSTTRGQPIRFEPGGPHLMIFDLDPALRPGDTIQLDFQFLLAPPASVRARIAAAGEPGPGHDAH
jgi:copper(I)-binding protein